MIKAEFEAGPNLANLQTKVSRQQKIVELLTRQNIASQSELMDLLAQASIKVTQATLSRDLVELRAEKVRNADGALIYKLPSDGQRARTDLNESTVYSQRLQRAIEDLLVSVASTQNQLVLKTPPGAAGYLASTLDQSVIPNLLGTIAGDDTILLIVTTEAAAKELAAKLLQLVKVKPSG